MSKVKCSSKNPDKCRYHGHDGQVAALKAKIEKTGDAGDYQGYYVARETLDALEKRKSLMDSLAASIEKAKDSGDLRAVVNLKASFKDISGDAYESPDDLSESQEEEVYEEEAFTGKRSLLSTDMKRYFNSDIPEISKGVLHPSRVFRTTMFGDKETYEKADDYDYEKYGYPDYIRISANRVLTEDEKQKLAGLTGYHYRSTMNGEPMSDPEDDGGASIILSTDMTKASGRKTQLSPFIDGLPDMWREGSPVRKTDRSGPGTAGTRLVEGFGYDTDLEFTLYLRQQGPELI